jgi:hypothetical protein
VSITRSTVRVSDALAGWLRCKTGNTMLSAESQSLRTCLQCLHGSGVLHATARCLASEAPQPTDGSGPGARGRRRQSLRPASSSVSSALRGAAADGTAFKWGQDVTVKDAGFVGTNWALRNVPSKVFHLIGDPRTGVADDTTRKPFGETTVDLLHEQFRSQVSWYKYEFAGNELAESHRDGRLSDYARNLLYVLRAKDPARWGPAALPATLHSCSSS